MASNWLLKFSIAKCMVLPLGKSRVTTYTMIDAAGLQTCLSQVSQVKYLGVWLTDSLTPTSYMQCQKAANKAMQVMGIIKRSFKYITKDSCLLFYKALIHPHLEYCIPS